MLKSINPIHKPLPELVAEQIKGLIYNKDLKAGDKLPNEFEMAEQLQVGRGTIREAVKLLVSQNILEIRRGSGTFVCERTGIIDDPLGLWLIEDKNRLVLDLCEVRLMLEPQIARLAAARASHEEIKALMLAADGVEAAIHKGENHAQADIHFHEVLAGISKNQVITKLIPVIQSSVYLFVLVTDAILKDETIKSHRAIADAVARHHEAEAENAMRQHLLENQKQINLKIRHTSYDM